MVERSTAQTKFNKLNPKIMKTQIKIHKTEFPFQIVENNKKFSIAIGNQLMSSKTFARLTDAKEYVKSKPYELIINATCFAMSLNNTEQPKTEEKNETKD